MSDNESGWRINQASADFDLLRAELVETLTDAPRCAEGASCHQCSAEAILARFATVTLGEAR